MFLVLYVVEDSLVQIGEGRLVKLMNKEIQIGKVSIVSMYTYILYIVYIHNKSRLWREPNDALTIYNNNKK